MPVRRSHATATLVLLTACRLCGRAAAELKTDIEYGRVPGRRFFLT